MQNQINIICHLDETLRDHGISQNDLARMTGVTQPAVSNFCLNKKLPLLHTAYAIADALSVPVQAIWEEVKQCKVTAQSIS